MSRFEKGQPGGPGRPKGSKNKVSEAFWDDLAKQWEEYGEAVLTKMREEDNTQFVKMVALLQPKDYTVTVDRLDELSIEELEERARELGDTLGIYASSGKAKAKEKPKHIN